MPFERIAALTHDLREHYEALRAIRNRRALEGSALYAKIQGELARVLSGVERGDAKPTLRSGRSLKAAAWNIQRGANFDGLLRSFTDDPQLSSADALLLVEVDCGMGRSGDRNVARDLADALGMSYAFGVSYLVLEDDLFENPDHRPNSLALAGMAILSRAPIVRAESVDLPELRDKFSSSEKRLGRKRALIAEVELEDGPVALAACHLDSTASPKQRALQLTSVIDHADAMNARRVLIGGDFNSSTYDTSSTFALARDLLHKFFVSGFRNTIDNYLTPERRYETPIFETLAERGFVLDGFNDRAKGTFHYDVQDPYSVEKARRAVGRALTWLICRMLRPWNGRVPARLDWFTGRGLRARSAAVADPRGEDGRPVSDHLPIVVDVEPIG